MRESVTSLHSGDRVPFLPRPETTMPETKNDRRKWIALAALLVFSAWLLYRNLWVPAQQNSSAASSLAGPTASQLTLPRRAAPLTESPSSQNGSGRRDRTIS